MSTKIYCLVLNYNHHLDTEICVNSLLSSDVPKNTKIIIIDNSPTTKSAKYLQDKFPKITIIKNKQNLGFAGGNNIGIKMAIANKATHVLIINPDVIVGKKIFVRLLQDFDKYPRLGLVAPAIKHYQGTQQFYGLAGHLDWSTTKATHTNLRTLPQTTKLRFGDFVTFACVLIKSEVFRETGLLDERYFMYLEDVDYCLMAGQKGLTSAVDMSVVVNHNTSSSFSKPTDKLKISFFSQLKFITKWCQFPTNIQPYLYALGFYPYLYLLWSAKYYRSRLFPKT